MVRVSILLALLPALLGAGSAGAGRTPEAAALELAKRQSAEAQLRSAALDRRADDAANSAERARAEAAALAARIEAAEADITAAETRVRIIEQRRTAQRARLAARQQPLVRLTAALQTMSRRPPALALVQPGSMTDAVHVRSLLASTLPVIRARTAALRAEFAVDDRLRAQAEVAQAALRASQQALKQRRIALARFEANARQRSSVLEESALVESDRALAFGEEARDLAALAKDRRHQSAIAASLSALSAPPPRPGSERRSGRNPAYRLPVAGRVVRGTGEISDAGVHARGVTIETVSGAPVVAPAAGRVVYAAPFRGYGNVVIIDHGDGLATTLTEIASLRVRQGDVVQPAMPIGAAGAGRAPHISIELRRNGRPVPIAALL